MRYARDERKNTHAHDFIVQTNDGGAITSKDSRENVTVDMLHVYALCTCIHIPIVVDCRKAENHRITIQ